MPPMHQMSCFWTAICAKIPGMKKHQPQTVIAALQSVNCLVTDVTWNGQAFSKKQMEENMEWVKSYAPKSFNQGHDTSICDPFLALLAQVFRLEIHHAYTGFKNVVHPVVYKHSAAQQTVRFSSTTGHFQ
jgi:hypothetical protein